MIRTAILSSSVPARLCVAAGFLVYRQRASARSPNAIRSLVGEMSLRGEMDGRGGNSPTEKAMPGKKKGKGGY